MIHQEPGQYVRGWTPRALGQNMEHESQERDSLSIWGHAPLTQELNNLAKVLRDGTNTLARMALWGLEKAMACTKKMRKGRIVMTMEKGSK